MPFRLPKKCLRGLNTCQPLSQLESDDRSTFICCGENDGSMSRVPEDRYTVCLKTEFRDDIRFNDERDLSHQAAVLVWALAVIEPPSGRKS